MEVHLDRRLADKRIFRPLISSIGDPEEELLATGTG